MGSKLDTERLNLVFQRRPDILTGIRKAADSPARINLFNEIATFVHDELSNTRTEEPASKRRRVDIAPSNNHPAAQAANGSPAGGNIAAVAAAEPVLLEIKDISISVPQRKKYDLCITKNFLYAKLNGSTAPAQGIVYAWKDIAHAFCLPVPEKSQAQHNYVLFPNGSFLPSSKSQTSAPDSEPLVFTVPTSAPKPGSISGPSAENASTLADSYKSLFDWVLSTSLRSAGNTACRVVSADPRIFHSVARQAFRPNEKAVHVKAFRGSKDGFLFFLPSGIFWGFKKPLMFLPLDRIVAVSYTSVLQRTFNIVVEIEAEGADGPRAEEIEFAMLDQEDYQGIDETYVKRHVLQDRSMADQRKAKRQLAENARNGTNGAADDGEGGDGGDGMTELEKAGLEAEQQLQDDEDEDEEDYDPGSDGESEGEGESSDEEDQSAGEEEDDEEDEESFD